MTYKQAIATATEASRKLNTPLYVFEVLLYGEPSGEWVGSYDRPIDNRKFETIGERK